MEGPQFSTRAESNLYRSWGCDVIGMTNMPEAKLAREAEICYATVAMVTDYDCWHDEHAHVDVAAVIKVLHENVRQGARPDRAARPRFPARASALPDRLRPRARRRHHHAARGARSGAAGQARRGGGARAARAAVRPGPGLQFRVRRGRSGTMPRTGQCRPRSWCAAQSRSRAPGARHPQRWRERRPAASAGSA